MPATLLVVLTQKGRVATAPLDAFARIVAEQQVEVFEMPIEKSRRSPYHAKKARNGTDVSFLAFFSTIKLGAKAAERGKGGRTTRRSLHARSASVATPVQENRCLLLLSGEVCLDAGKQAMRVTIVRFFVVELPVHPVESKAQWMLDRKSVV